MFEVIFCAHDDNSKAIASPWQYLWRAYYVGAKRLPSITLDQCTTPESNLCVMVHVDTPMHLTQKSDLQIMKGSDMSGLPNSLPHHL